MNSRKACIIYVPQLSEKAEKIASQLKDRGFSVCTVETDITTALMAKAGSSKATPEICKCMEKAEICIFLIAKDTFSAEMADAAEKAVSLGCRTVVALDADAKLPGVFDDFANAVCGINNGELIDIILEKDVWQLPDGSDAPPRKPTRVRCQ